MRAPIVTPQNQIILSMQWPTQNNWDTLKKFHTIMKHCGLPDQPFEVLQNHKITNLVKQHYLIFCIIHKQSTEQVIITSQQSNNDMKYYTVEWNFLQYIPNNLNCSLLSQVTQTTISTIQLLEFPFEASSYSRAKNFAKHIFSASVTNLHPISLFLVIHKHLLKLRHN